jgi:predicted DNA-binding transcriptional regulator AlpA
MRLLRYHQLKSEKFIDWSRVHIARLEKLGLFPMHINLGPGTTAWVEAEIDEMIASKVAQREQPEAGESRAVQASSA